MKKVFIAVLDAGAALAQTPEINAIKNAAGALGGVERVRAVKTLIMEGAGANPNVGQNVTPDAPLTDWKVSEYEEDRRSCNIGACTFEQRRDAQVRILHGERQSPELCFGRRGVVQRGS